MGGAGGGEKRLTRCEGSGGGTLTCAMRAARQHWRSIVDLPPMLGPLSTMNGGRPVSVPLPDVLPVLPPPREMSLGTKEPPRPGMPACQVCVRAKSGECGGSLRWGIMHI